MATQETTGDMPADLHGWSAPVGSPSALARAVDHAFDYRGDVTITLQNGAQLVGYVFNREHQAADPYLEIYPATEDKPRRVFYREIAGLEFSGRDAAEGRSWEAWLKTVAAAEAAGQIAERYPESL